MRSAQIENFFALAQYKNFSKAAEYCFITQPALSKNISALEKEVGVTLFRRTSRGVELTDAGKRMYDFFQKSSSEYMDALKDARDLGNASQVIRIALMDGVDDGIFWDFLYRFREKVSLAELNFRFSEDGDRNIALALMEGTVDCAVAFLSGSTFSAIRNDRISTIPIQKARHRLYYSDIHPETWGDRKPVPEDFKDSVFYFPINTDRMQTSRGIVKREDYFGSQLGFPIRCEICESVNSIYQNVIIDHGVAILLDCNYSKWHEHIRSIPLDLDMDPSELVFAWRKDSGNEALQSLTRKICAN